MRKQGLWPLVLAAFVSITGAAAVAIAGTPADPTQQTVSGDSGIFETLAHLTGRVVDSFGDILTHPNVLWSLFAVLVGAGLSILVTEFMKRFSPLLPQIFEGEHWVLKIRLFSALVGGALAALLDWRVVDGDAGDVGVFVVIAFIAAAAASPTLYDLAYKLAPSVTDRLLKRVRGEA